jgi:uncharacterized membrane protein YcaP (DUF421 family)
MALIIGDLLDDLFWAEVPLANILFWHIVLAFLATRSRWLDQTIIDTRPRSVISAGQRLLEGLKRERIPENDFQSLLRVNQIEALEEVKAGNMEPCGILSILHKGESRPVQRKAAGKIRKYRE